MIQLLDMNAPGVDFYLDDYSDPDVSRRVQFHVVGTKNFFSSKSFGKRPSSTFVGMRIDGESPKDRLYLATSTVKCRHEDEPEWFDNLGPLWLSPSATITFHVKTRSKFPKSSSVLASTEAYPLRKLCKMQGYMDRKATISLPLRSHSHSQTQADFPADASFVINLRELSTSKSGMEEHSEYISLKSTSSQRSSIEDELNAKNGNHFLSPPLSPTSTTSRTSNGNGGGFNATERRSL